MFTFLIGSMAAMGLTLTPQSIIAPLRNARLVLFALALNFVLAKIGNAALLVLFILIVALNVRALLGVIGSGAILAALLYVVGLFAAGWVFGEGGNETRGVIALSTAARNFGAALVPAASSFNDPKVTVMLVVSAIVCLVFSFLAAGWVRRRIPQSAS